MRVTIKAFGDFRESIGKDEFEIDIPSGAGLHEALSGLIEGHPELREKIFDKSGEFSKHLILFVNECNARSLEGSDRILEEGDRIVLTSPFGGG